MPPMSARGSSPVRKTSLVAKRRAALKLTWDRDLSRRLREAIEEDVGPGDATTERIVPRRLQGKGILIAKASGVFCGAPVADALGLAIRTYDLPRAMLLGMIDARSADLDGGGFADFQALKAYLYKSQGAVFALGAHILGGGAGDFARVANAAGLAYGLAELLRNLPRDTAAGRVMAPLSLLQEHNVDPELLLAGEAGKRIHPVVAELAREARAALEAARKELALCDKSAHPAFAPLKLVQPILAKVEKPGRNPLRDIAEINPLLRFWRLWRAARSGWV